MKRSLLAGLAMLAAVLLIAGCDGLSPGENEGDDNDLSREYGGYTTADEAPGFGDPALVASHPEDTPYTDEVASSPEVRDATRNGWSKFYMLRMVWGNIDNPDTSEDSGSCAVTDWSGSIEIDGGLVIIRRLIRFEDGDSIVRPRRGARDVEWISHTHNHVDGLLLEIIDVPDPRHKPAKNSVTITTPLHSVEIPFDSLPRLNQVNTYDACNKVALVGAEVERRVCPRGFLEGVWVSQTDTSGYFEGAWIAEEGTLVGHLKGRYTVRDTSRVLFGKWITPSGKFGGLLKGTWGLVNGDPDGYFEGTWVDKSLAGGGRFSGRFGFPSDTAQGVLRSRWMKDCR